VKVESALVALKDAIEEMHEHTVSGGGKGL
jgi:hypothetical protein